MANIPRIASGGALMSATKIGDYDGNSASGMSSITLSQDYKVVVVAGCSYTNASDNWFKAEISGKGKLAFSDSRKTNDWQKGMGACATFVNCKAGDVISFQMYADQYAFAYGIN